MIKFNLVENDHASERWVIISVVYKGSWLNSVEIGRKLLSQKDVIYSIKING